MREPYIASSSLRNRAKSSGNVAWQVAARLGITVAAVRTARWRVKERLTTELEGLVDNAGASITVPAQKP